MYVHKYIFSVLYICTYILYIRNVCSYFMYVFTYVRMYVRRCVCGRGVEGGKDVWLNSTVCVCTYVCMYMCMYVHCFHLVNEHCGVAVIDV